MDDMTIKSRLVSNGFTKEEIAFIAHWAEKEKSNLVDIIIDLRSYFLGGIILRIIILSYCAASLLLEYNYGAIIFTLIFSLIAAEILAPFKVGAKIYFKFNKIIA